MDCLELAIYQNERSMFERRYQRSEHVGMVKVCWSISVLYCFRRLRSDYAGSRRLRRVVLCAFEFLWRLKTTKSMIAAKGARGRISCDVIRSSAQSCIVLHGEIEVLYLRPIDKSRERTPNPNEGVDLVLNPPE